MRPILSDRLREVVTGRPRPAVPERSPELHRDAVDAVGHGNATEPDSSALHRAADVLGGRVETRAEGGTIVVDRFYPAAARYGRLTIGEVVERLTTGADALGLLGRAWPSAHGVGDRHAGTLLFLDLETTGLAGGAGTYAFLAGCAVIRDGGLLVRQFLLPGFEHERALLAELLAWASQHGALVTYNGRTFDVPLIETRFFFNRLPSPVDQWPHLDMLHTARRLWKARPSVLGPPPDEESCRLSVLERHLAGVTRVGDVPGLEIPSRFFQFIRYGDAGPLQAVLEHNRLDLVSLALVTARAVELLGRGPAATRHGHECLGLGGLYERAAALEEAEACYAHAAALFARVGHDAAARAHALKRLALCRRRSGRLQPAAEAWAELAELPLSPARLRREAQEALAIHYEHRVRDLERARAMALQVLRDAHDARCREAAQHRVARLERKRERRPALIAAMEA